MLQKIKKLRMPKTRRAAILVAGIVLVFGIVWSLTQQTDAVRFQNRGMYINSARGGDETYYIISLQYTTPDTVGSLRMEFCDNPIPSLPCNVPTGLDVSNATLAAQSGETGFAIDTGQHTQNLIVLTRTPSMTGSALSSYRFDNMRNPDGTHQDFYVRMTSHSSTDGTGPFIDYGSVTATTTPEIELTTQVPPILIFCVAQQINGDNCTDMQGNFVDFGELSPNETFSTSSEIQARTNAQHGYTITVSGTTMTSGWRSIPAITAPTESFRGVGQFGMNLADNTSPDIGADPVGPGINGVVSPPYDTPDKFLFNSGDIVASSDNVTRTRKYTASYIVNVPANQPPGVYSTTVTYICTAGF
jgi:hypothetical protein